MKKRLLFLLISLAFVSTTCKKPIDDSNLVCTETNTIKIPQTVKDYFFFKRGSWWVYKETKTGIIDSIWTSGDTSRMSNPIKFKRYCNCGKGKCSENENIDFEDRFHNKKDFNEKLFGYYISASIENDQIGIIEGGGVYLSPNENRINFNNTKPISPSTTGPNIEVIDTLNINGISYLNIIHLKYDKNVAGLNWLQEAWFGKNIYMLKYMKSDSTVWELQNYHINQ